MRFLSGRVTEASTIQRLTGTWEAVTTQGGCKGRGAVATIPCLKGSVCSHQAGFGSHKS